MARARSRRKPREEWLALRPGTHEGYVDWERSEAIRRMVSDNIPNSRHHGAAKHGDALLAGLIRCQRCGRKLTIRYTGTKHNIPRYSCTRGWLDNGEPRCIAFGGLRVDDAIEAAILKVVEPSAITAAIEADAQEATRRDEVRDALIRDLEARRYAADRAFRQYDAADPANRLVAAELELRWNRALTRVSEMEARIADHDRAASVGALGVVFRDSCRCLENGLASADDRCAAEERIVRAVVKEVVADIDAEAGEIILFLHWMGGIHTELRLPRRRRGRRDSTSQDIVTAVRQLVLISNDDLIAGILNRNKLTTGRGNRWTRERVTALRSHHKIPVYYPAEQGQEPWLNLSKAAAYLQISSKTLRVAAECREIDALHPVPDGPWILSRAVLDSTAGESAGPSRPECAKHPAGRVLINKIFSLQRHREMGVMKRGCNPNANYRAPRGHATVSGIRFRSAARRAAGR
jgi:Recombinase zinc beta ribbon domain